LVDLYNVFFIRKRYIKKGKAMYYLVERREDSTLQKDKRRVGMLILDEVAA
jgi:hypothetical protein